LDNGRADCILANATEILQTQDGADDVACAVRLARRGNVTEFSAGDGSIDGPAEFDAIMRAPGNVKLVDEINWCGTYVVAYGCAPMGGSSLAVVPASSNTLAGILWAHEYGHTKGLGHRDADNQAVMYYSISAYPKKVSQAECSAFRE